MRNLATIAVAGLALSLAGVTGAQAGEGKAAAQELGCTACHAAQTKLVGPAYKDVAAKYGGDKARILER
ncbi:MAG TPA: c-type cytochrome, partial [Gammaproteobacteria bacterium]|nr:c-type cytochrome [Gammaproteobacteria bacterium]